MLLLVFPIPFSELQVCVIVTSLSHWHELELEHSFVRGVTMLKRHFDFHCEGKFHCTDTIVPLLTAMLF